MTYRFGSAFVSAYTAASKTSDFVMLPMISIGAGMTVFCAQNIGAGQVQYAPGKVVKKLVYCLLAFFLGWAGIHKFYAGRIGAGIVYLLFCWTGIPAIIAFIEFIIGLCKKADAAGNIVV